MTHHTALVVSVLLMVIASMIWALEVAPVVDVPRLLLVLHHLVRRTTASVHHHAVSSPTWTTMPATHRIQRLRASLLAAMTLVELECWLQ